MGFLARLVTNTNEGEWPLDVKTTETASSSESILKLNNIEVMYHEVILVLKGVSIEVPRERNRCSPGSEWSRKIDYLKIHLRPIET